MCAHFLEFRMLLT